MVRRAAKGRALWPALLATAAALLAGTAEASLPTSSSPSELLAKPALTAALANAEQAEKPRFDVRLSAHSALPVQPHLEVEAEKHASGLKTWEPQVNIRLLRYFASISRQRSASDHRARFYDPSTQTFLEPDPLGPIDSPNLYQAFSLDGFNVTDPWGLQDPGDDTPWWRRALRAGTNLLRRWGGLGEELQEKAQDETVNRLPRANASSDTYGELETYADLGHDPQQVASHSSAAQLNGIPDTTAWTAGIATRGAVEVAKFAVENKVAEGVVRVGGKILEAGKAGHVVEETNTVRQLKGGESLAGARVQPGELRFLPDQPRVIEGRYEFPDQTAGGIPYVGQSGNVPHRLAQHEKAGRLLPGTEETTEVLGGKTAREIEEHKRIQELTGGVPAAQSGEVANKVDPIGPKRRHLLGGQT